MVAVTAEVDTADISKRTPSKPSPSSATILTFVGLASRRSARRTMRLLARYYPGAISCE